MCVSCCRSCCCSLSFLLLLLHHYCVHRRFVHWLTHFFLLPLLSPPLSLPVIEFAGQQVLWCFKPRDLITRGKFPVWEPTVQEEKQANLLSWMHHRPKYSVSVFKTHKKHLNIFLSIPENIRGTKSKSMKKYWREIWYEIELSHAVQSNCCYFFRFECIFFQILVSVTSSLFSSSICLSCLSSSHPCICYWNDSHSRVYSSSGSSINGWEVEVDVRCHLQSSCLKLYLDSREQKSFWWFT